MLVSFLFRAIFCANMNILSDSPKHGVFFPYRIDHILFYITTCLIIELQHEISNNVVCATNKVSDQPALTRSLIRAFATSLEYSLTVKLLTERYLEFLSLKAGCTGLSESILVKRPHCWKSHVMAQIYYIMLYRNVKIDKHDLCCYANIYTVSNNGLCFDKYHM